MKRLIKYFLTGVAALAPLVLTVSLVTWLFEKGDNLLGQYYRRLGVNIPGLGLLTFVLIVILVGYFTNWYVGRAILNKIDRLFNRLPLIKTIYSILKETVGTIFGEKKAFGQPVILKIPGSSLKVIGLITNPDLTALGFPDHVAVYVPQSLQWAGFTFLVPKSELEEPAGDSGRLTLTPEEAMKFIISAGVAARTKE